MSDSFLFQSSKTKFQLLVFGTSLRDARTFARAIYPGLDMKYLATNPTNVPRWVVSAVTDKQKETNRAENFKRFGDLTVIIPGA